MLRFMGFIYGWKMQTVIYESKIWWDGGKKQIGKMGICWKGGQRS
jgi:hypothetical protein